MRMLQVTKGLGRAGIAMVPWWRSGPVILVFLHVFFQGILWEIILITIITLICTFTAIMFMASLFFMNNLRQRGKYEILKLRKMKTCFFIHVAAADVCVSHSSFKIFPLFGSSRKPTSTGIQQIGNLSSAKALWCNKTFSQSIHLKTYQSIHPGDKPFACSQCEKNFFPYSHPKT